MPIYPSSPREVMRTRKPPESCMAAAVRLHTALLQDFHPRAHVVIHVGLNYLACSPHRFTVPVGYGQRYGQTARKKRRRRLAHSGSTGNLDSRHQGGELDAWYPNRLSGPRRSLPLRLFGTPSRLSPWPELLKPTRPLGIKASNWYVGCRNGASLRATQTPSVPRNCLTEEARTTTHPRTTAPCFRG
ncbi:hypothetical protein CGRA01v4_12370 [Colletotrichum graminicola]|nr:hypothetical protein CGRA01v4_12370 [Colletotrichum graminicola]